MMFYILYLISYFDFFHIISSFIDCILIYHYVGHAASQILTSFDTLTSAGYYRHQSHAFSIPTELCYRKCLTRHGCSIDIRFADMLLMISFDARGRYTFNETASAI
jgi:hypothetical protein